MVLIYDLEVFPNFFLAGFLPKDSDEPIFFEISAWKNDCLPLLKFLEQEGLRLIGYNNLNYDYPLLHYLLNSQVLSINDPDFVTQFIYKKSDDLIGQEFTAIPEWEEKIPQLDVYRIHHLDNRAKSATLKDIEFNIRHSSVEDLVIPPYTYLFEGSDDQTREEVLKYNLNDLLATRAFYFKSSKEIKLRKSLSRKYNLKLLNANDPKMGSEIFAAKLAPKLGITMRELRQMRTERAGGVLLKDCVFPYVNFKTPELQKVLEKVKTVWVYEGETKGAWKDEIAFKGVKYKFGLGGIHGCIYPGFYKENEGHVIITSDVTSYYPNLSIKNRFYPRHLTSIYCDVYEDIFNERKTYPKGTPENYGLKIALNGSFGKSNDKYSFFKDLKYMLTTTVNGQLLLMMLAERVSHLGQILMANTDGIEILIPKENVDEYYAICKKWEKFTRLELEHGQYKSMAIRDVNNYRAIFHNEDEEVDEDKTYEKGVFEINKMIHKDHSQMVVPKALKAFYEKGTPVKQFIENHDDIFDFYIRLKIKSNFSAEIRYVSGQNINTVQLSKTTRYYASKDGGYIYRINDKDEATAIRKNQKCTIANSHQELSMSEYHIDYQYYIRECNKVINAIDQGQIKLF